MLLLLEVQHEKKKTFVWKFQFFFFLSDQQMNSLDWKI